MADNDEQLGLATAVTIAWLSNPHTRAAAEDVSTMLGSVLAAFRGLDAPTAKTAEPAMVPEHTPAVSVRRSLASPNHILSMIDGKPYRSLTRHLSAQRLTPDQYRQRFGLRPDYPMVAPSYSAERSAAAKQHNFGRPAAPGSVVEPTTAPASPEPDQASSAPPPSDAPTANKRRKLGIAAAKKAAQTHLGEGGEATTDAPPAQS